MARLRSACFHIYLVLWSGLYKPSLAVRETVETIVEHSHFARIHRHAAAHASNANASEDLLVLRSGKLGEAGTAGHHDQAVDMDLAYTRKGEEEDEGPEWNFQNGHLDMSVLDIVDSLQKITKVRAAGGLADQPDLSGQAIIRGGHDHADQYLLFNEWSMTNRHTGVNFRKFRDNYGEQVQLDPAGPVWGTIVWGTKHRNELYGRDDLVVDWMWHSDGRFGDDGQAPPFGFPVYLPFIRRWTHGENAVERRYLWSPLELSLKKIMLGEDAHWTSMPWFLPNPRTAVAARCKEAKLTNIAGGWGINIAKGAGATAEGVISAGQVMGGFAVGFAAISAVQHGYEAWSLRDIQAQMRKDGSPAEDLQLMDVMIECNAMDLGFDVVAVTTGILGVAGTLATLGIGAIGMLAIGVGLFCARKALDGVQKRMIHNAVEAYFDTDRGREVKEQITCLKLAIEIAKTDDMDALMDRSQELMELVDGTLTNCRVIADDESVRKAGKFLEGKVVEAYWGYGAANERGWFLAKVLEYDKEHNTYKVHWGRYQRTPGGHLEWVSQFKTDNYPPAFRGEVMNVDREAQVMGRALQERTIALAQIGVLKESALMAFGKNLQAMRKAMGDRARKIKSFTKSKLTVATNIMEIDMKTSSSGTGKAIKQFLTQRNSETKKLRFPNLAAADRVDDDIDGFDENDPGKSGKLHVAAIELAVPQEPDDEKNLRNRFSRVTEDISWMPITGGKGAGTSYSSSRPPVHFRMMMGGRGWQDVPSEEVFEEDMHQV